MMALIFMSILFIILLAFISTIFFEVMAHKPDKNINFKFSVQIPLIKANIEIGSKSKK
jgi:hypothetical protein